MPSAPAPSVSASAGPRARHFWLAVLLVTMLAWSVRVALTVQFVGLDAPPDANAQPDQLDYELFAWRIASGQGLTLADGTPTARRTPGTSLALVPVYAVAGRDLAAGRLWFCLLSALSCVAAAWAGRALRDPATGLLAAAMVAVYPNHAYFAMHFLSEGPAGTLAIAATAVTVFAFRRGATSASLLAGLLWGAAVLVRPNLLLVLPLLVLVLLRRRWRVAAVTRALAVIALAVLLVLLPLVLRNARVMGVATLATLNAATLWGAHNDPVLRQYPGGWLPPSDLRDAEHPLSRDEVERDRQMMAYTRAFVRDHLADLPALELAKLQRFLSPFGDTENRVVRAAFAAGWMVAGALMVPGLFWAFRRKPLEAWVIMAPVLAMVLTSVVYYGALRFRDVVAANYLVFSAVTVSLLVERWAPRLGRPAQARAVSSQQAAVNRTSPSRT